YTYQSIGNQLDDGTIYGARYMAWGSIEWQRPVTLFGDARSFEHAVFVDAGAAADEPDEARLNTGVGTGLRWASPVGPLQLDAAYGLRTQKWRLHLRVGFQFGRTCSERDHPCSHRARATAAQRPRALALVGGRHRGRVAAAAGGVDVAVAGQLLLAAACA